MTQKVPARSDGENLRILEELRPRHKSLMEQKIRVETNVERTRIELADAQKQAEETFGTSDIEALRAMALDGYAKNTAMVDEFSAAIAQVESEVAQIMQEGAVGQVPNRASGQGA